jgi:hypothetical protein
MTATHLHLVLHFMCMLGKAYKLWSSSLCSFLQPPITSSLLGPNILLCTLFLNTLCSCLSVREQVSNHKEPEAKLYFELYRPSYRRLSVKLVPAFADRRCHVVGRTDAHSHILDFLDRSRYFSFQIAPQLCSQGWVDPVPDPLLLRKFGSARKRTRTSGSGGRNSYHKTTEGVLPTMCKN